MPYRITITLDPEATNLLDIDAVLATVARDHKLGYGNGEITDDEGKHIGDWTNA